MRQPAAPVERLPTLADLREAAVPEPISWAPQTPAWTVLGVLVALALLYFTWRAIRRWRARRYRRDALRLLDGIDASVRGGELAALGELPALVKRTALGTWTRAEIASLSGASWLRLLDRSLGRSLGGTEFSNGAGRLLPQLAYDPDSVELDQQRAQELLQLVRLWIRRHQAGVESEG